MEKKNRRAIKAFIVLWIILVPAMLYADMGPKPRTTIKITNPPKGTYYIDLLMEWERAYDDELVVPEGCEGTERELLGVLLSYRDENGWRPRFDASPIDNGIHCNNLDDVYTFSYMNVPDDFRIIIVTKDKQVHVSPVIHKHTFEETMTYDYATGTVRQKWIIVSYLIQFLMTCIPTLFIEGSILKSFKFNLKENLKIFLGANIGTQLMMTIVLTPGLLNGSLLLCYVFFVMIELLIMLIECIIYGIKLVGRKRRYRIAYGIVANLASAVAGFFGLILEYAVVNL